MTPGCYGHKGPVTIGENYFKGANLLMREKEKIKAGSKKENSRDGLTETIRKSKEFRQNREEEKKNNR